MNRKTVLLIATLSVATALGLPACSPDTIATSPPGMTGNTAAPSPTASPIVSQASTSSTSEKPEYGGMIVKASSAMGDPGGRFDPGNWNMVLCPTLYITTDSLARGDWTKGPAGTGQTDWLQFLGNNFDLMAGMLAESWEMPDPTTLIWHLRKDVHFWNMPPVNGREFTADDAVWNINRQWFNKNVFNAVAWPPGTAPTSVEALDKYTVQVKCAASVQGMQILATGAQVYMIAPEVVEKYGNVDDWHNFVATGPFRMTDYVPASSITFVRNPDYWQSNPVGPGKGDQLPYANGIKWLIIDDASTREAAFRTGKADYIQGLSWDDYSALSKQVPATVEHQETYGLVSNAAGRIDKGDLPFKDVRVRQALNMAVDQKSILDSFYQGHGELLSWPFYSGKDWAKGYIPLDQLPQEVQDLFGYDPDKARQLLAEAGYPNGFKTSIVTTQVQVDLLSIVKEYLSKVGVDMSIKVVENNVYNLVLRGRSYDEMIFAGTKMYFIPWQMNEVRTVNFDDVGFYDDPDVNAAYEAALPYVGKDGDKVWSIQKAIVPYMISQCPMSVYMPVPYNYDMWWPWLKNFYDATRIGHWSPEDNLKYAWVDQALKTSIGY